MGTPDETIYGKLTNTVAVSTLVGLRIYPDIIPANARLPAMCYSQHTDPIEHAMCNDPNVYSPRYQIDIYSTSWGQMRSLSGKVRDALRNYSGTTWCNVQNIFYEGTVPMTEIDPETKQIIRRASQDYIIWWSS